VLKHFAANRKRWLSALPNVGPYIYTVYMTLKFLALQGAPYIYDISNLRVKMEFCDAQTSRADDHTCDDSIHAR
jgi:hypothetical protein